MFLTSVGTILVVIMINFVIIIVVILYLMDVHALFLVMLVCIIALNLDTRIG